jgi:hypothetical protein
MGDLLHGNEICHPVAQNRLLCRDGMRRVPTGPDPANRLHDSQGPGQRRNAVCAQQFSVERRVGGIADA